MAILHQLPKLRGYILLYMEASEEIENMILQDTICDRQAQVANLSTVYERVPRFDVHDRVYVPALCKVHGHL